MSSGGTAILCRFGLVIEMADAGSGPERWGEPMPSGLGRMAVRATHGPTLPDLNHGDEAPTPIAGHHAFDP